MKKSIKIVLPILLVVGAIIAAATYFFQHYNVAVLNPQGDIARQERDLIVFTTVLGMAVVIPVFAMLGIFAWKFREGNHKANYRPEWDGNKYLEIVWWGIPCAIILVLSVVTWRTSHDLDPYKALSSDVKPLNVQVVALQWKWLFIYPDLGVASANLLEIPEKTPVNFTITADAPMNSFWIPSLGSQVYAMTGMSTQLHLIADHTGDYRGSSANISGKGFADMKFTARSTSMAEFHSWVGRVRKTSTTLDQSGYDALALPASLDTPMYYVVKDNDLYDRIVMKYMAPMTNGQDETQNNTNDKSTPSDHGNPGMMDMPGMEGM
ncbi:MAG: cyoA [Candidatus Saccharibacteria bacterium]|nr:cyoA [Candidatus Saccharibacteria bacterium]